MMMTPIHFCSEQPRDYAKALGAVTSLDDLRGLTANYRLIAADAEVVAHEMTEADFETLKKGLRKERRGKFAGEAFAEKYGAILAPAIMLHVCTVANRFKVPWGLAYIRCCEAGMIEERAGIAVRVEDQPS